MKHLSASIFSIIFFIASVYVGVELLHLDFLFAVVLPYAAIAIFIFGVARKMFVWARSPVPFNITTTIGQQKSLAQIKSDPIGAPTSAAGVVMRLAREVLFFHSLMSDTNLKNEDGVPRYRPQPLWWLAALAFHWSMLIIVLRHFRFFVEPPLFASFINSIDGFVRFGQTALFATDFIFICSISYLFFRRIAIPRIRYLSLTSDWFAILLFLAIAISGIAMTLLRTSDVSTIKLYALGLFTFHPSNYESLGFAFNAHLFLVCALLTYFPFSKLMHMPGVFFSSTLNMTANSRATRHINPWNAPAKGRTYEEWEDEFRPLLQNADIPVEKE